VERIRALRGLSAMGLATLCGAVLALAQPPASWPLAVFVALPALLWLSEGGRGWRGGFALGWAAGAGFFAVGMFWIVEPFLVDPERHGWMAPFALVGMAGGLALFWGAAFALARAVSPEGAARAVALACAWTLAECARSHVLTGFPWALPAYAWVETPVMQVSAWIGPHGLGFLTLLAGLLPGAVRRGAWAPAALAVALVAAGWNEPRERGGWRSRSRSAPVP